MSGVTERDLIPDNFLEELAAARRRLDQMERIALTASAADGRYLRLEDANAVHQLLSVFLTLPGLRGLWPFTSMGDGGVGIDLSGQGRTLTNNNGVLFSHSDNIGHAAFASASSQYFSRADEAGLSILGNEAYVDPAIQGLTLGGWLWCNAAGTNQGFFDKGTGINQSYRMSRDTSNRLVFQVSDDGTNVTGLSGGDSPLITGNGWFFCIGRHAAGTPLRVYVNNVATIAGGNTPANPLFDSTAAFEIGRFNGGSYLNGRAALCFICAAAVPESGLTAVFEQSRGLFGV